mmetsp:Transcript_7307/g.23922  ORF Transcript_7307/g.23922 Transcript_7307/m.23922 type:complete len:174 (-) Transcript_7307:183-704(-)
MDGADVAHSPETHGVSCMRDQQTCRDNGYGLLQRNDDNATYALAFTFDDDGNKFTLAFLDATDVEDDVYVRATGIPGGAAEENATLSQVTFTHVPSACRRRSGGLEAVTECTTDADCETPGQGCVLAAPRMGRRRLRFGFFENDDPTGTCQDVQVTTNATASDDDDDPHANHL